MNLSKLNRRLAKKLNKIAKNYKSKNYPWSTCCIIEGVRIVEHEEFDVQRPAFISFTIIQNCVAKGIFLESSLLEELNKKCKGESYDIGYYGDPTLDDWYNTNTLEITIHNIDFKGLVKVLKRD